MRDLRGSSATTPKAATATSGAVAGPRPARESRCATPCPAARPACSRTRGGQRQPRPDRACPAGPALRRAAADALDANARRGRRSASSPVNDPARGSGGAYARFREGVRPWNAGCLRCADCDPACRHSGCAISDPYRRTASRDGASIRDAPRGRPGGVARGRRSRRWTRLGRRPAGQGALAPASAPRRRRTARGRRSASRRREAGDGRACPPPRADGTAATGPRSAAP